MTTVRRLICGARSRTQISPCRKHRSKFLMLPCWRLQGPCFRRWKRGPSLSAELTRSRSASEAGPAPVAS